MKFLAVSISLLFLSLSSLPCAASDHPEVHASPSPIIAAPSGPSQPPMIAVAEPAAPPAWAQDLIVGAEKLPVIGPVVSKILLWSGIVSSILTLLVGFMISAISALRGVFNWAGLANAALAITAFQNGKFMYWLKFFSMFNAKKSQ